MDKVANLNYIKCNLCGLDDYRIIYKSRADERIENTQGNSHIRLSLRTSSMSLCGQIVRCNNCGLVYVNPRENEEDILKRYKRLEDRTPILDEEGHLIVAENNLRLVKKYIKKGKVLDIGCGVGLFLLKARECGWITYGLELSSWAADYAKNKYGLCITRGTLKEECFQNMDFDLITLWNIIEHFSNPKDTLKIIYRLLKQKGILAISTPDIESIYARILGRYWWSFERGHLYYFSQKTLERILKDTGFKVLGYYSNYKVHKLKYLITMIEPYNKILFKLLKRFIARCGLAERNIVFSVKDLNVIALKE